MKDIKFRAWYKAEKKMYNIEALYLECRPFNPELAAVLVTNTENNLSHTVRNLSDIEIMQYIGLKDNHGIEIYEGDIVELLFVHPVRGPYTTKARVIWANFQWQLRTLEPDEHGKIEVMEVGYYRRNIQTVVDNIYDQGKDGTQE